jgi:hypothetical protein
MRSGWFRSLPRASQPRRCGDGRDPRGPGEENGSGVRRGSGEPVQSGRGVTGGSGVKTGADAAEGTAGLKGVGVTTFSRWGRPTSKR